MIDLKGVNMDKLMKGLNDAATESLNMLNAIDIDSAKDLMTPEQILEFNKAKREVAAIKKKDFANINKFSNQFKS